MFAPRTPLYADLRQDGRDENEGQDTLTRVKILGLEPCIDDVCKVGEGSYSGWAIVLTKDGDLMTVQMIDLDTVRTTE